MLTLRIKNQKIAAMVHESLVGTPEYVNSKIVLSEMKDGSGRYELIVGEENKNDLTANLGDII